MNWRLTRANSRQKNELEPKEPRLETMQEHRSQHVLVEKHRSVRSFRILVGLVSSLAFSGLGFSGLGFAQGILTQDLVQGVLTRDDAVKAAENLPGVIAARARLSAAEAQMAAAQLPISGNVTGGYTFAGSSPAPPPGTELGGWNLSANLSFAGLRGEANDARVNAILGLERARRGLVAARLKAQKTAVNLWHGLRRAESGVVLARRNLDFSELQDRAADARFKAGAISVSDRETVMVSLENARLDALRAESRLESARVQLAVNLGLTPERTSNDWKALTAPDGDGHPEAREDVFEARAAVVTAGLELDRVWRGILPTANLDGRLSGTAGTVQAGLNSNLGLNAGFTYPNSFGSSTTTGTSWSVSISATIPITPAQWGQVGPAEQNLRAAQAALDAALKSARADVQARRAAVPLALRALEWSQKALDVARANLDRAKTRAASGVIAAIDVTRAELDVLRAQDAVLSAQYDLDTIVLDVLEALAVPLR
jgi:outer membrane protein